MKLKNVVFVTVLLMLLVAFLLGACQPAPAEETQVVATDEPVADETDEVATEESATEPVSQEPQVGGTFVMEYDGDVDTFDIQKISGWGPLESFLNATMVTLDPVTNQYAPYLAESWTVSDDGLTYEFKLRQDVIFHNGDPLTAEDWIYTLERAVDPDTASPISSEYWTKVVSYEAVDDFTLRLTIAQPDYTFLLGLAQYPAAPVSQQAIEEFGEDYSRNPVGTGLYIFQEYSTGENIVLRRNPDYKWGPSWVHAGPAYIENVIIRIIPEYSTRLAGLEAGEIDFVEINDSDLPRIRDDGDFEIFDVPVTGIRPFVLFNVSKSPFDDLRVRQAFSYAVDRESLITVVLLGNGKPLYGTLNEGTIGYDPGLEEQGIHHDLNKAKALMQEAGYTYDENGMLLTPEGELFVLDYPILQMFNYPKVAEVLVEQYKALGVTLNIMLEEVGIGWQRLVEGDYEIAVGGLGYTDADVLYFGWHSSSIGAINLSRVNDPVMDEILERTRSEIDPTARQVAVTEAQLDMMEQAYIVPLFNSYYHYAVNRRVQGIIPSPNITYFWFQDAFIVED